MVIKLNSSLLQGEILGDKRGNVSDPMVASQGRNVDPDCGYLLLQQLHCPLSRSLSIHSNMAQRTTGARSSWKGARPNGFLWKSLNNLNSAIFHMFCGTHLHAWGGINLKRFQTYAELDKRQQQEEVLVDFVYIFWKKKKKNYIFFRCHHFVFATYQRLLTTVYNNKPIHTVLRIPLNLPLK